MSRKARKFVRITKFLLAGVTLFCVSWILSVNEWHAGVRWSGTRTARSTGLSTMRTIIGYSEGKLAEMERPSPVTCDRLPAFPHIPYHDKTWTPGSKYSSSWQLVTGTKVSLYDAYYDDRSTQKYVRILAMFNGRKITNEKTLYCQTRSLNPEDDFIEVVAAKPLEIWWHKWDTASVNIETPVLLSCPLTGDLNKPSVVSVVTQPCDDPENAFKLLPTQETQYKSSFTICVKDMNFDKDISQKLIEWIETNKLLGVNKIDFYVDKLNKRTESVLQFYSRRNFVRLFNVPISSRQSRTLWQRRRDHIITYNDCLYRNLKETAFIIPLDIDEVIIPKKAQTLLELLVRLKNQGFNDTEHSSVLVRNVFFFDFMQVSTKQPNSSKSIYLKRDDVRLNYSKELNTELELDRYINLSNEVIDLDDSHIFEKYKKRCGVDLPIPKLIRHVVSSALVSPKGYYSKSIMLTKKVLTAFNHYPLASLSKQEFYGSGYTAPLSEVQLNHYKEQCDPKLVNCQEYGNKTRVDVSALYLHRRLKHALANTICI